MMSLSKENKKKVISKFAINKEDTGSAEVQIAVLSERINNLINHFREHKKDNHSRRGLIKIVSKRRKLLKYLIRRDYDGYQKLIKELGIRR